MLLNDFKVVGIKTIPGRSCINSLGVLQMDYIAIGGFVAAVIFGAIAAIQSYRAHRLDQLVSKAQGVFKTPNMEIIPMDESDVTYFLLAVPIQKGRVFEFPMRFTIANSGEKTAEDVEVLFRIPKNLCYDGENLQLGLDLGHKKVNWAPVSKKGNFITFIFDISSLHPKQGIDFAIPLSFIHDTISFFSINAPTADNVNVTVSSLLYFNYVLEFVVFQKNQSPVTSTFSFFVVDTSERSIQDTLIRCNRVLLKNYREEISKKNFFSRFFMKPSGGKSLRVFQVDKNDVSAIGLIDRVKTFTVSHGVYLDFGFFIPALGIVFE
jgi:hypothetical protein